MYYYYVICDKAPTYTVRRKYPIKDRSELNDKRAKYVVPISFFEWVFIKLRFTK